MRRFVARRGKPRSFKARKKWLKQIFASDDMQSYLEEHGIQWKFDLAKVPWWGGFYERLVGSVKCRLRKVLSNARLTFKELSTVLTKSRTNTEQTTADS